MRVFFSLLFVAFAISFTYITKQNDFNILEIYSMGPLHYIKKTKTINLYNMEDTYYVNTKTSGLYVPKFNRLENIKFNNKVSKLKSINTITQILDKSDTLRIVYSYSDHINYPPNPHMLRNDIRKKLMDNSVGWFGLSQLDDFILKGIGEYKIYYFIRDYYKNKADLIEIDRTKNIKVTIFRFTSDSIKFNLF